jgi:hypothetical protein
MGAAQVLAEKIQQYIQRLPASFQAEVLDFVEYLVAKAEREALEEEEAWSDLSLSFAMRGMEYKAVPTYTASDLKVVFP